MDRAAKKKPRSLTAEDGQVEACCANVCRKQCDEEKREPNDGRPGGDVHQEPDRTQDFPDSVTLTREGPGAGNRAAPSESDPVCLSPMRGRDEEKHEHEGDAERQIDLVEGGHAGQSDGA